MLVDHSQAYQDRADAVHISPHFRRRTRSNGERVRGDGRVDGRHIEAACSPLVVHFPDRSPELRLKSFATQLILCKTHSTDKNVQPRASVCRPPQQTTRSQRQSARTTSTTTASDSLEASRKRTRGRPEMRLCQRLRTLPIGMTSIAKCLRTDPSTESSMLQTDLGDPTGLRTASFL